MDEAKYRAAEARFWGTTGMEPTETYVRLPRIGVRVRVLEVGEGPPVLFVHGGPNAASTWAPLVARITGYRCLMVDRPGTGLSDHLEVRRDDLASYGDRFVGDVLDGLEVERAHIVASSFGGYLALRSSAAEPERVDRMVQMACPALAPGSLTPPFMRMIAIGWLRRVINLLPPNRRANESILRQIGHGASLDAGRISADFTDWYEALQRYTDTMRNDGDMIGSLVGVRGFDPSDAIPDGVLAAVAAPTRFLWGADDGFGGEEVARRTVGAMPHAELLMVPAAGHLPWIDDPSGIAAQTVEFLASDAVPHRTPAVAGDA